MKQRLITISALFVLLPCAGAQRTGHAASYHSGFNSGRFAGKQATRATAFNRRAPHTSLPFPLFTDAFDLEDLYSAGYPVASQPPDMLLQSGRPTAYSGSIPRFSDPIRPSSTEPLMIELHNGRYVHVSRSAVDGEAAPLSFDSSVLTKTNALQASTLRPLPATLLVFRDGRTLEVRDYTIANGVLYVSGDYYTDGYWSKQIALSTLNLSETLQANASRNVKFILPAAANEVIAAF